MKLLNLFRMAANGPPTRQEIIAYGSFALFVVGFVIVGFGLANTNVPIIAVGVGAIALPLFKWVRVKRSPEGEWTVEGETFPGDMEKPPDSATPEQEDERDSA